MAVGIRAKIALVNELAKITCQQGKTHGTFSTKTITFVISFIVAVLAVAIHSVAIPHVESGFLILLVAYLILVAGNVLSGV